MGFWDADGDLSPLPKKDFAVRTAASFIDRLIPHVPPTRPQAHSGYCLPCHQDKPEA